MTKLFVHVSHTTYHVHDTAKMQNVSKIKIHVGFGIHVSTLWGRIFLFVYYVALSCTKIVMGAVSSNIKAALSNVDPLIGTKTREEKLAVVFNYVDKKKRRCN